MAAMQHQYEIFQIEAEAEEEVTQHDELVEMEM